MSNKTAIALFVGTFTLAGCGSGPTKPESRYPVMSPGWEIVTISREGQDLVYIKTDSIKKEGNIANATWAVNYSKPFQLPSGKWQASVSVLSRFDCIGRKSKDLKLNAYSGHNLQGDVVDTQTYQERKLKWENIKPGSVADKVLKRACSASLPDTYRHRQVPQ
jgi:hypothetical protein